MQNFDPFVLPFSIGVGVILILFVIKLYRWIAGITITERKKIVKGLFSFKIFTASWEVLMESLLHRKIFKQNLVLGFMHMSLAFGWFMLIVIGNIESRIHAGYDINPFWFPIFFDFFVHDKSGIVFNDAFTFFMDFFLLLVLSGVALAFIKRFLPGTFGMKKTTKLRIGDKFALYSLWLIFPLRLLAESFTAGIYNSGGFMTASIGNFASGFFDLETPAYILWWAYSLALGCFFVALPFSRYLHIPAEVILIFFRKFGVSNHNEYNGFTKLEIDSCSRCGICIDKCQVNFVNKHKNVAPAYYLRSVRYNEPDYESAYSCLLCGRCQDACPVGIGLNNIRLVTKAENFINNNSSDYSYLPEVQPYKAKVAYFAGCMTHLTPSIIRSMKNIFKTAGIDWTFIDENGGVCCGRPAKLTGDFKAANDLVSYATEMIVKSGAETLVTSCPICLKVFKEDYKLNINIVHHSQFIDGLINEGKIVLNKKTEKTFVYHDPCELGRGLGIYEEPRRVINKTGVLVESEFTGKSSLCCGGSLANTQLGEKERDKIAVDAVNKLTSSNPDALITACPLCKKTFVRFAGADVKDIAEIVSENIVNSDDPVKINSGSIYRKVPLQVP